MSEDSEVKNNVKISFWLIIVADSLDTPPKCIECEDQTAFEEALRQHVVGADSEIYAFAFKGSRVQIGSLQPVGSYILDGQTVSIQGATPVAVDASGRITAFGTQTGPK